MKVDFSKLVCLVAIFCKCVGKTYNKHVSSNIRILTSENSKPLYDPYKMKRQFSYLLEHSSHP